MKHKNISFLTTGIIFVLFLNPSLAKGQYATNLTVTDIDNVSVSKMMEQSSSQLLTEFNNAFFNDKTPGLNIKGLDNDGKKSILSMWETSPFRCIETEIIERGYSTPTGYQIRNIPLFLKGVPEDESYAEIAINFNKRGEITDIYFTVDYNNYMEILNAENNDVQDLRNRSMILDFVENFRTAYNRKDLNFLQKVYSNDALIITGKVVKVKENSDNYLQSLPKEKIEYQIKTKKEYLAALAGVFKNNAKINVNFEEIEVARHPRYEDIYGVTIKQYWNTTTYSDIGYLFLMIDFRNPDNPQIHVRTWQPEKYNGKEISKDEIFHLGSFDEIIN
jgi:hypothetical protein